MNLARHQEEHIPVLHQYVNPINDLLLWTNVLSMVTNLCLCHGLKNHIFMASNINVKIEENIPIDHDCEITVSKLPQNFRGVNKLFVLMGY